MTLTASPTTSSAIDHAAFGDLGAPAETWFTSVDHRRVGRLITGASLLLGVLGTAVLGLVVRKFDAAVRGVTDSSSFLGSEAERAFSFERVQNLVFTATPYFVLLPLFLGIATASVPALIGGRRMAFPRLQSFVLWGYVVATATFLASFIVGDGPPHVAVWGQTIPASANPANRATDLLLGSLMLVTVVTFLGAVNIVITVATQRRMGLRLSNIRPFAFASLVTGGVLVLTTPVFLVGLLLLEIDQHFGGGLFGNTTGATRVWSHMIWFNGRPEALLVLLPAVGALVDVISTRVGAAPAGGRTANVLLGFFGAATFTAWAADSWNMAHLVQPHSTIQAALVGLPLGLLLLLSLGTLAGHAKTMKMDASLVFALGTVLLIVLGVANIAVGAIKGITAWAPVWSVNQALLAVYAAPVVGLLAAAVEFVPRLADRRAHAAGASLGGLFVTGGFAVLFVALGVISLQDSVDKASSGLSNIAMVGGLLAAAGIGLSGLAIASSVLSRGESVASASEVSN